VDVGTVHLWHADLDVAEAELERLRDTLCAAERRRSERFRFERHRRRFVTARGFLRDVLARYLGVTPDSLTFDYGPHGKPSLARPADTGRRFNLSHSGTAAVLAVALGRDVGVDIERINPQTECMRLAQRFFAEDEVAVLAALPPPAQPSAFFEGWTRKEAYIKALGCGLTLPLRAFSVGLGPGQPACLLRVESDARERRRWGMADVDVGAGFKAALVAAGRGWSLRCWQWRPPA